MANKKFSKFLAFAAIAGTAIAAGIAYFKHKNNSEYLDDDLDDFDDDFDDDDFDFPLPTENGDNSVKREYVPLNMDKDTSAKEEENEDDTATETSESNDANDTTKTEEAADEVQSV